MPNRSPHTAEPIKRRAQDVPRALQRQIDIWAGDGPQGQHQTHILFAELYLCTTRNWLQRLEGRRDSTYAYLVIGNFLDLFQTFVVEGITEQRHDVVAHWARYDRVSRTTFDSSPLVVKLWLVLLGARAHTHHDLGLAMLRADQTLGTRDTIGTGGVPSIFGAMSSDAFFHAALEFVQLQRGRYAGRTAMGYALLRITLIAGKPLWLMMFQNWRKTGYAKAKIAARKQPQSPPRMATRQPPQSWPGGPFQSSAGRTKNCHAANPARPQNIIPQNTAPIENSTNPQPPATATTAMRIQSGAKNG